MSEEKDFMKADIDQLSGAIRQMGDYTGNDETKWFDEELLPQYLKHNDILKYRGMLIAENAARKAILDTIDQSKYEGITEIEKKKLMDAEIEELLKTRPDIINVMYDLLQDMLLSPLVDTAKVRRLDAMPETVRAYATAPYHEDHVAQWKEVKYKLASSIQWNKNDYPQWYITGPRGSGKSYFETTLMTLAMAQKAWIYTTKDLTTKYKKYYRITRRSDLYADQNIPSVLRVYLKAKEDEEEYGFPSSLYALVIKDEGGSGKEAKYQTLAQEELRTEWQFGRHTRCVYVTAGFQTYNPKTMELFMNMYAETEAKETVVTDVDGAQKKYHTIHIYWMDGTDEYIKVPPSQLALDSEEGLNIATAYVNDLDMNMMFTTIGYTDKLFAKDPDYFIGEFAEYSRKSRDAYDFEANKKFDKMNKSIEKAAKQEEKEEKKRGKK